MQRLPESFADEFRIRNGAGSNRAAGIVIRDLDAPSDQSPGPENLPAGG